MSETERNVLISAAEAFLRSYPPFTAMTGEATHTLAGRLKLAYFAKGTRALDPSAGLPTALFIVQRGRIESRRADASSSVDSTRALGPGEVFPISALMSLLVAPSIRRTTG